MPSTDLHHLLAQEKEIMGHLLFSLEKEHALLLDSYSNDALFDLTELKNHYADQLAQTAKQRDALLVALGFETGIEGLRAAQNEHEAVRTSVHELLELTEKAQALNEENGLLINTYLEYSEKAIETLDKANPTKGADQVYDAKGLKSVKSKLGRGIASV